jgi:hypothetical protein
MIELQYRAAERTPARVLLLPQMLLLFRCCLIDGPLSVVYQTELWISDLARELLSAAVLYR